MNSIERWFLFIAGMWFGGLVFAVRKQLDLKRGYVNYKGVSMTKPTKEQSLDIERAMGFEIPWYRIEEIIIRWEKIRNSPK